MPCNIKAPNSIAAIALPGIPNAIVGINDPPATAEFAASEAIIPSAMPVPYSFECLENFLTRIKQNPLAGVTLIQSN